MVIFHSYVKLPEGSITVSPFFSANDKVATHGNTDMKPWADPGLRPAAVDAARNKHRSCTVFQGDGFLGKSGQKKYPLVI